MYLIRPHDEELRHFLQFYIIKQKNELQMEEVFHD